MDEEEEVGASFFTEAQGARTEVLVELVVDGLFVLPMPAIAAFLTPGLPLLPSLDRMCGEVDLFDKAVTNRGDGAATVDVLETFAVVFITAAGIEAAGVFADAEMAEFSVMLEDGLGPFPLPLADAAATAGEGFGSLI